MKKLLLMACFAGFLQSCDPDDKENPVTSLFSSEFSKYGYFGSDNNSTIPVTTNFGFANSNLPSSIDLTSKFPPVSSQGAYGTCVAWAVGYNVKTAIEGMDRGLSASQLASASNQISPKDLFTAVPDGDKGPDCNGTNFDDALKILLNRGAATLQTVPYTSMGNCSQSSLQSSWATDAANHKIKSFRKIDATISSVQQNLANNVPVIFGAKLGDNFMDWNSDAVLSSHSGFTNVGIHAYHAMAICGYDNNKGSNGAFKVVNSWGSDWGNNGYIWVDYNFFFAQDFLMSSGSDRCLYIAVNEPGNTTPPTDDPTVTGVDLVSWVFEDKRSNSGVERKIDFNIYNVGTTAATTDIEWSCAYIYYNAYDVFHDRFNTSIQANTYTNTGNDYTFNYDIQPNGAFAESVFGIDPDTNQPYESLIKTYDMPNITGTYYLVLIADAYDILQEQDEMNNLFYTTEDPINFTSGRGKNAEFFEFNNSLEASTFNLKNNQFQSALNKNKNAYSPEEIKAFLKAKKKSGEYDQKLADFKARNKNNRTVQPGKR